MHTRRGKILRSILLLIPQTRQAHLEQNKKAIEPIADSDAERVESKSTCNNLKHYNLKVVRHLSQMPDSCQRKKNEQRVCVSLVKASSLALFHFFCMAPRAVHCASQSRVPGRSERSRVPRRGVVLDFCTVGREYRVGRALRARQKATNHLYLPNNDRNIA
jgi:hypothetical protein